MTTENKAALELLPCPFCGGHARPMKCQIGISGTMSCNKWVTITCSMCEINNGGKGGFMRPRYNTEEEAARAWNTRQALTASQFEDVFSPFTKATFKNVGETK